MSDHRFDHLVVLMLENRSFDNICGYLYEDDLPKHFIPDRDRPSAARPNENLMRGFVQDYIRVAEESKRWDGDINVTPELVQQIMNCFPPEAVPVRSTLARSFAVSDDWFSSVPSSTWPNRSFTHSGTSRSRVVNKPATEWALHPWSGATASGDT